MNKEISGLIETGFIVFGCSNEPPIHLGSRKGNLTACPDAPNCISTKSSDSRHAMPPLPFIGTKDKTKNRIIEIIRGMKRSNIIDMSHSYIYAQFRTGFWRFVDDVEFFLDDDADLVHFRSASRVGYYDFGLNRRRMRDISKSYLKK